jgi:hypothetical protein
MPGIELIRSLLQQATAQGSRSTALNPLGWALAIILSALLGSAFDHPPTWLTPVLAVCVGTVVVAYLAAYFFLLVKDRDALRSERFQLSKMAIERSIVGDNIAGFLAPEKEPLPLPSAKTNPAEGEK